MYQKSKISRGIKMIGSLLLFAAALSLTLATTANAQTDYYNLFGHEGIGTRGGVGTIPPVGDFGTTHCRYIDVPNTAPGDYFLRYPLHLPTGVTITKVSFFVADFNPAGVLWFWLRSRPWNSRDAGTVATNGFALSDNSSENDKTVNMDGLNVTVDNKTTQYWIDVSPKNSAEPGQLCVYGIQVTYSYPARTISYPVALPVIMK